MHQTNITSVRLVRAVPANGSVRAALGGAAVAHAFGVPVVVVVLDEGGVTPARLVLGLRLAWPWAVKSFSCALYLISDSSLYNINRARENDFTARG